MQHQMDLYQVDPRTHQMDLYRLDLRSISWIYNSWIHAASAGSISAGSAQHQLDLYQLDPPSISWIYDASA